MNDTRVVALPESEKLSRAPRSPLAETRERDYVQGSSGASLEAPPPERAFPLSNFTTFTGESSMKASAVWMLAGMSSLLAPVVFAQHTQKQNPPIKMGTSGGSASDHSSL